MGFGYTIFLTRWLALSSTYEFLQTGPFYGSGIGLHRRGAIMITKPLECWPKTVAKNPLKDAWAEYTAPQQLALRTKGIALEGGFGYAPDVIYAEESGEPDNKWQHPFFYSIGATIAHGKCLESGIFFQLIDVFGSVDDPDFERDQFYAVSVFSRYQVLPFTDRYRPFLQAHVRYSDLNYVYETGLLHKKNFTVGFAPMFRFVANNQLYLNLSMEFNLTLDKDRNTLATNYPRVSFTWFPSKI